MKEKLKQLNLRLTELANYLNISRPTLYKYLDEYESKNYKDIDKNTRKVFDYVKKRSTISKVAVIDFIINDLYDKKPEEIKKLYQAIEKDENLTESILLDIHEVGVKGVLNKIKSLYEKGSKDD